jgi:hypothetical protein
MEKIMKLKLSILALGLLALPILVLAQASVNGTWTGEVQGGRGAQMVTLNLKADGNKLTGTSAGGRGGDIPIENGTIMGNMLKFTTKQMGRGGEVTLTWTGTLKGDEIAFSRVAEGGQPVEFTLKRMK